MWKTLIKTVTRPITYIAESLLLFAVENNLNKCAKLLIKCGVNVNCNNSDGTPLWHAVKNSNLYLVNTLLSHGADVNSQSNKESKTALHLAAQKDRDAEGALREYSISKSNFMNPIIDALIAAKPNMNLRDQYGQAPLHIAVKHCYLHATKAFIKAGADPNPLNKEEETPIMQIVRHTGSVISDARSILRVLIAADARLDHVDKGNRTILQKVADYRYRGFGTHLACKTLLFYGSKLEELTENKQAKNGYFTNLLMLFTFDQAGCIKKSAQTRESIRNTLSQSVSSDTLKRLRLEKANNIPEKRYPDHKGIKLKLTRISCVNCT